MRSLSPAGRHERRVRVIQLRRVGHSYDRIASETGLSRTGVFDICKRHAALGAPALHDAAAGRRAGEGRTLTAGHEGLLKALIVGHTPDELGLPDALWTRRAVGRLIELRLGIGLPARTLDTYLGRWGFTASRAPGRKGRAVSLALEAWLIEGFPAIVAQCKAQGGEILWGSHQRLADEHPQGLALAPPGKAPGLGRLVPGHPTSLISSVSNKGHQRWNAFVGALDASVLIDFLQRLIQGAQKKICLIMDGPPARHELPVAQWLAEHEDEIQVFDLPGSHPGRQSA